MNLKKARSVLLRGVVEAVIFLTLYSCSYFTEPDPYVNDAHPPTQAMLANFKEGQHVTGEISLSFAQAGDHSQILRAVLAVNGVVIYSGTYPPVFDTRNYPDGEYTLSCQVWMKDASSGIGNLRSVPTQTLTFKLNFDNAPPLAPTNLTLRSENSHVILTWAPSQQENFHSYVVRRNGDIIARVSARDSTTFTDDAYLMANYEIVSFDVGVSNSVAIAWSSPTSFNTQPPLGLGNSQVIVDNIANSDEILLIDGATILEASSQTGSIVVRDAISIANCSNIATNPDKSRVYFLNSSEFSSFDIPGLKSRDVRLNMLDFHSTGFAVGLNDVQYMANPGGDNMQICFFHESRYVTTNSLFNGSARYLAISIDGATMLAADNQGLKSFSVARDTIRLLHQSSVSDQVTPLFLDRQNSRVFLKHLQTRCELWNTNTLEPTITFQPQGTPSSISDVSTVTATSQHAWVAYAITRYGVPAGLIVEYDISTGQQLRTWTTYAPVRSLGCSEAGRYLFVCTASNQWSVDLGGTH